MSAELLAATSGAVASFLSGLLGIGGGIVIAPLLLYAPAAIGAGALPVKIITGLTIVQAISGSILGSLHHGRRGYVSMSLVRLMGPPGAVASLVGALVSFAVADRAILGIFAAFSLISAPMLFLPRRDSDSTEHELRVSAPLAISVAAVIGFFGGIVGIGAIGFLIAALVYLLRVPTRIAIGTSLGIGMFSAVAALVGKAATAQIDPPLAVLVLGAALVASPIGVAVSHRTRPQVLMSLLAAIVALSGVRMGWQAITGN